MKKQKREAGADPRSGDLVARVKANLPNAHIKENPNKTRGIKKGDKMEKETNK